MRLATTLCLLFVAAQALLAQSPEIGPPPGKLVDIGGRKLHHNCAGFGGPTVVLEAGASAFAIDWTLVQPTIARTNRVCSYDRAGSGWSEPSGTVETPERVALDLHALLGAAGEKPPYVLVGASRGGIYIRIYDLRYPGEVAGMVFVDPAHEDGLFTLVDGKGVPIWSRSAEQVRASIPPGTWTVHNPARPPQTGAPFDRLPPELFKIRVALETRLIAATESVTHDQVVAFAEGDRAALAKLHETGLSQEHPLGSRPVIVLSRGIESAQRPPALHASLARQSTNSRHTVVAGAGHEIHLFEPPAVIQAIQDVVAASRSGMKLSAR